MSYPFTLYSRPNGKKSYLTMTHIDQEEVDWFTAHGTEISMEEVGPRVVVYATTGKVDADGEPIEVTYIVPAGQRCLDAMKKVRALIEEAIN